MTEQEQNKQDILEEFTKDQQDLILENPTLSKFLQIVSDLWCENVSFARELEEIFTEMVQEYMYLSNITYH